MNQTKIHSAR